MDNKASPDPRNKFGHQKDENIPKQTGKKSQPNRHVREDAVYMPAERLKLWFRV